MIFQKGRAAFVSSLGEVFTKVLVQKIGDQSGAAMGAETNPHLEPQLQLEVGSMRPVACRKLAIKLKHWAHQLEVSAKIIEVDEVPGPPARLKFVPAEKAAKN